MALSNDTPAPTKPQMAGCQQEPCSRSLSAETEAEIERETEEVEPCAANVWTREYVVSTGAARRLARQRDEARADVVAWKRVAQKLAAALTAPPPTVLRDSYDWEYRRNRKDALDEFAALSSENASGEGPPP